MIRDFWGIKKGRLIDEVNALKEKVNKKTWRAIKAVKDVGNIGAHMEKNINVIIDVEPNEASLLINLIEKFINTFYFGGNVRLKLYFIWQECPMSEGERLNTLAQYLLRIFLTYDKSNLTPIDLTRLRGNIEF